MRKSSQINWQNWHDIFRTKSISRSFWNWKLCVARALARSLTLENAKSRHPFGGNRIECDRWKMEEKNGEKKNIVFVVNCEIISKLEKFFCCKPVSYRWFIFAGSRSWMNANVCGINVCWWASLSSVVVSRQCRRATNFLHFFDIIRLYIVRTFAWTDVVQLNWCGMRACFCDICRVPCVCAILIHRENRAISTYIYFNAPPNGVFRSNAFSLSRSVFF